MSRSMKTVFAAILVTALGATLACTGGPTEVGAVLPLEGSWAIYGDSIQKGIELAYEQIQEEGAVTLELEIVDSGSDPDRAAELLAQLYRGGAVAAIGGVTTESALKMVPVAERVDKVLLSPSASGPGLTGISRYFFRIYPSDFREGNKMGNFTAQELGIDRIVILAAESPYARGIQDVFKTEYVRQDDENQVLDEIEYPSDEADFEALVERALAQDPVGIYVADYAQNVARIVTELREQNFQGKILTTSAFASPEVIAEAGEAAEGVLLTQVAVPEDDPALVAFQEAYQAKYGERPNIWAAHGYDAMNVLAEAIRETGSLPSDVWKGLRGLKEYRGASGVIQFDEKGDVGKFPRTYVIENGELVDYDRALEEKRQEILRRIRELSEQRGEVSRGDQGGQ